MLSRVWRTFIHGASPDITPQSSPVPPKTLSHFCGTQEQGVNMCTCRAVTLQLQSALRCSDSHPEFRALLRHGTPLGALWAAPSAAPSRASL